MARWVKLRKAIKNQYRFGAYAWRNLDQEQPKNGEVVLIKWKTDSGFWMLNVAVHTVFQHPMSGMRALGFTDLYTHTPLNIGNTFWTALLELPKSNRQATSPWSSIRERTPKPKDLVLVLTPNNLIALGFIQESANPSRVFHELYSDLPLRVTHWAALQDLPAAC
jgi:hypothetical protein